MFLSEIFKLILNNNYVSALQSLFIFVVVIILFYNLINKLKNQSLYKFADQFPGPSTIPYFGNSLSFLRGPQVAMEKMIEYTQNFKISPYRLWFGSDLYIVLSDPEHLEAVFYNSNAFDKPESFERGFADIYGKTIFTMASAEKVKTRRKRINHVFSNNALIEFISIMNEEIDKLSSSIDQKCTNGSFVDVYTPIAFCNFDIVTRTMMNLLINPFKKETMTYHTLNLQGLNISLHRMYSPLTRNKFLDGILCGKTVEHLKIRIKEFFKQVCKEQICELQNFSEELSNKATNDDSALYRYLKIIYQISLEEGDENILYDEIQTIIGGGTTTISITACFFLLMIGMYPDIQTKLYDEITKWFSENDRKATWDDLKHLPYLDQVLKETQRRFTLAPYVYRRVIKDMKIGKIIYPAGTNLILSILGAHFNENCFPNPWEFNPENFNATSTESRPKCAFIPFALGPRNCPGMTFANLELKLMLIELIRKYHFNTNIKIEDIKMINLFVSTSANGFPIFVTKRNISDPKNI